MEHVKRTRRDAYPEDLVYVDRGCNYHPSCLTCPFVVCRYDMEGGGGIRALQVNERIPKLLAMRRAGKTNREMALALGISVRSVHRLMGEIQNGRQA